ncbi:25167_t:CDS:2 [Gigaspora margarita]|uniref:25167_t:CDS:1 n=1 Tax=Gigaspora margarita TaxID=4874 RepID=A0ABM8VWT0_GIGMA|nr:25167_t:CDS:2 [Gigaspora margarita]
MLLNTKCNKEICRIITNQVKVAERVIEEILAAVKRQLMIFYLEIKRHFF